MKPFRLLTLAVTAMLTTLHSLAYDFSATNADGVTIYYNILSEADKTVEVIFKDFQKTYSGAVVIPEKVDYNGSTYTVTAIGKDAFNGCYGLTSVTIPNSVTTIGYRAFYGCTSLPVTGNIRYADTYLIEVVDRTLSSYDIKDETRFIGTDAFYGCINLTSITIPNSVTEIGYRAFGYCYGLNSVTIPNSVTAIRDYAFQACSGLASMTVPTSVTEIGDYVFESCTNLSAFYGKFTSDDNRCLIVDGKLCAFAPNGVTSYSIPKSVTEIGDGAFKYCAKLTSVTIGNAVKSIGFYAFSNCSGLTSVSIPNSVTEIGGGTFEYCSSLISVSIPNSVTEIVEMSFTGCTNLTSVTIGSSVTFIGFKAFSKCSSIASIYAKPLDPPGCDNMVFDGVDKITATLYVPQSSIEAYKEAKGWRDFFNIVPDTSSITEVAEDEDTDTSAVYYDLNGVRVERPESGKPYIRQKGESTQKIIY